VCTNFGRSLDRYLATSRIGGTPIGLAPTRCHVIIRTGERRFYSAAAAIERGVIDAETPEMMNDEGITNL
jgi:hypothetical protein